MDKMLDWIEKLIDQTNNLVIRYITIPSINKNPKLAAELYFDRYKNDRDDLDWLLGLIIKYQEHLGYYNYTVFMRRIKELSK